MLEKIRKRLSGVLDMETLMSNSISFVETEFEGDSDLEFIKVFIKKPAYYEEWKKCHYDELKPVALAKNKNEQILFLRKAIVPLIESSIMNTNLLTRDDSEKVILWNELKLHKNESFEDSYSLTSQICLFSEASCYCLRLISLKLGDARKNDWFTMYSNLYSQYIKLLLDSLIETRQGKVAVLSPLLKPAKVAIDEVKPKIFQGENWDWDD